MVLFELTLRSRCSNYIRIRTRHLMWMLVSAVEKIICSLVYFQKPTAASLCIDIERWSLSCWSFSGFSSNRSLGNRLHASSEWRWDQTINRDYDSKCSSIRISFVLVHHERFVETCTSTGRVSIMNDEICSVSIILSPCFSDSASSRQGINRIVNHLWIYSLVTINISLL